MRGYFILNSIHYIIRKVIKPNKWLKNCSNVYELIKLNPNYEVENKITTYL